MHLIYVARKVISLRSYGQAMGVDRPFDSNRRTRWPVPFGQHAKNRQRDSLSQPNRLLLADAAA